MIFEADWLRTMPIPVLAGLGNHDYENNVGDCVANNCAQRMLHWLSHEYAPSLIRRDAELMAHLDLRRQQGQLWRTNIFGSLAYSSRVCAIGADGKKASPPFCVHSLQLHNRPDYAASIEHPGEHWHIHGSFHWLMAQLDRLAAEDEHEQESNGDIGIERHSWPNRPIVLINLHNHEGKVAVRLKNSMELWYVRETLKKTLPWADASFSLGYAFLMPNPELLS